MRKVKWSTYRKAVLRAETAERRAEAIEELLIRKTGHNSYMHALIDYSKAQALSPRNAVMFTNIQAPAEA